MTNKNLFSNTDKIVAKLSVTILLVWTSFMFVNVNSDPGYAIRHVGISFFNVFFLAYFFLYRRIDFTSFGRLQLLAIIAFTAFAVVGMISAIAGINSIEGIFPFLINLNYIILIVIGINLFRNDISVVSVSIIIAIIGGFTGFFGILQYHELVPETFIAGAPPTALQFNRNFFGSSQVLCLPFALACVWQLKGLKKRLSIGITLIIIWSISISETRSAVLSLIIFALVLIIWVLRNRQNIEFFAHNKKSIWIAVFVLIVGGITLSTKYFDNISPGLKSYFENQDQFYRQSSIEERLIIWKGSLDIFSSNPLMGVGFGNWKIHYANSPYQTNRAKSGRVVFSKAHNVYLEILCETGILGFLLYSIFLFVIFKIGFLSSYLPSYKVLFGAGFLAYLVDYIFSFGNYQPTHVVYSGIVIGIILSEEKHQPYQWARRWYSKAPFYLAILVALFALYWSYAYLIFERHFEKGQDYGEKGNLAMSYYHFDLAIESPHSLSRQGESPHLQRAMAATKVRNFDEAIVFLNDAWIDNPYSSRLNAVFGAVYFGMNQIDKAAFYYEKVLKIQTTNRGIAEKLAICYYKNKQYEQCIKLLEKFEPWLNPNLQMMLKISRIKTTQ